MKIELFISDKDNNSIKYTERIYNTLVTSYIQFLSHSEIILVYIFPKSNNYSITDTMLSSYFQIRAKFHPYIRDRSKVSSWCKTQLKRLASWRLAKERKIIHRQESASWRSRIDLETYRSLSGNNRWERWQRLRKDPTSRRFCSPPLSSLCFYTISSTLLFYNAFDDFSVHVIRRSGKPIIEIYRLLVIGKARVTQKFQTRTQAG